MKSLLEKIVDFVRRLLGLHERRVHFLSEHVHIYPDEHPEVKREPVVFVHKSEIRVGAKIRPQDVLRVVAPKLIPRPRIVKPPAGRAVTFLQFVMPKRDFERVFAQTIQDFRDEYFELLAAGEVRRAWCRNVFIYGTLALTIAAWSMASIGKMVAKFWRLSG